MGAIRTGHVSFGVVGLPVHLYSATEAHGTGFHQVHASRDGSRIKRQRVCGMRVRTPRSPRRSSDGGASPTAPGNGRWTRCSSVRWVSSGVKGRWPLDVVGDAGPEWGEADDVDRPRRAPQATCGVPDQRLPIPAAVMERREHTDGWEAVRPLLRPALPRRSAEGTVPAGPAVVSGPGVRDPAGPVEEQPSPAS